MVSAYSFYPFSTAPAPFDVVWSRFPLMETPDLPAQKARPALVKVAFADQNGNPWVTVVYGTSKAPYKSGLEYFTVATLSEMNQCGLRCATRFDLSREMTLPWAREFFTCIGGKPLPIIGHLPDYEVKKLQTQISYLQHLMTSTTELSEPTELDFEN